MINNRLKLNKRTELISLLFANLLAIDSLRFVSSQHPANREQCKCNNLAEPNYRVVNGSTSSALKEGLPWIGFIFFETVVGFQAFCTATVISRYWVLTGKRLHGIQDRVLYLNKGTIIN